MIENIFNYILCFSWIPMLLTGLLGLLLGWLLFRGKKVSGDLSLEGEGALRAEADGLRARVRELEGKVGTRDGEVSDLKGKLAAAAAGAATAGAAVAATKGGDDDESYALEWRNRYLAARVKYLEGRLSEAPKAKAKAKPKAKAAAKPKVKKALVAKAAPKKAAAKKAAPKKKAVAKKATTAKTTTRKKPGPKPGTKRGALTAAGKPRKKPGPKPSAKKAGVSDADKWYVDVKKYHKSAKRGTVDNIVKYCGIALRSRDGQLVACSDETELDTVNTNFVKKKLGITAGNMDAIKATCVDMKADRFKKRPTFYYLLAKREGKLGVFDK